MKNFDGEVFLRDSQIIYNEKSQVLFTTFVLFWYPNIIIFSICHWHTTEGQWQISPRGRKFQIISNNLNFFVKNIKMF